MPNQIILFVNLSKKRQNKFVKNKWKSFFIGLGLIFLSSSLLQATYVVKKKSENHPVFQNAEEKRLYRLRHNEILTDGGYLSRGVWGKMEGVIETPSDLVWRLYIQINDWRTYGLPALMDSRALTKEMAEEIRSVKKLEEAYHILGDQVVNPVKDRRKGVVWVGYGLEYYDLPWPVANRWMVLKYLYDETRAFEGIYKVTWSKLGGNVETMDGEMLIQPFEGESKKALMQYNVTADPGSSVPKFLMKWGVKKTMPAVIRAIRRTAEKAYARPIPLLKTQ